VLGIALTPNDLAAQVERKVGSENKTKQTVGDNKTDFHIEIHTTGSPITIATTNLNGAAANTITGSGTKDITIDWTGLNIGRNKEITWGWTGTQKEGNSFRPTAKFTPSSPTDVPTLGWEVTPAHEVFLLNGYSSPVSFSNLLFQFPAAEFTTDSLLALLEG